MKIFGNSGEKTNPVVVLSVLAILVSVILGLYVVESLSVNHSQFLGQTKGYQRSMRQQVDIALVRLKDTAAFILAGQAERVYEKLGVASRVSANLTDLGYFYVEDGVVETFVGDGALFADPREHRDALARLQARLLQDIGLTVAISPLDWRELIPDLPDDHLVLLQAMPTGDSRNLVVFGAIDVAQIAEDSLRGLDLVRPVSVRLAPDDGEIVLDLSTEPTWIDRLLSVHPVTRDVTITRNLTAEVRFREHFNRLVSLLVMVGGLSLVLIAGAAMVIGAARQQKRDEEVLEAALHKAEAASEAKSVFLANMSHEIRTPLNGVLGMAELLMRTQMNKDQRRYASQIASSGNTLLSLLNDILDISKLESGQLAIDPVSTELPELVTDIVRFYGASAQHKGLALILDLDPRLPTYVEADPTRIRQVLGNLISNAIKFTNTGEVLIAVKLGRMDEEGDRCVVEFSVRDTGIGIAEEAVARLFSRFTQAEASTTRIYGGTGLGLSICKEICELMGGSIGVTSEAGKGSVFSFALPLPMREAAPQGEARGLRIALLSSSETLRQIVKANLEAMGAECALFHARKSAPEAIASENAEEPFDAVAIDDQGDLPTALKACERMRAISALAGVPIVVLGTQEASPAYLSFDGVVVKPFDCRAVVDLVHRLADGQSADGEVAEADSSSAAPAAIYNGLRALLVDDNSVNLMFGNEVLEELGFEVTNANNGLQAVEQAETGDFDVVFMDCQMPVMDGYEATGRIREQMREGAIRRVPIVAVTANALKGDREKCLDAGMDSFLTKPFKVAELKATLSGTSLRRRARRAASAQSRRALARPAQTRMVAMTSDSAALAPTNDATVASGSAQAQPAAPRPAPPKAQPSQAARRVAALKRGGGARTEAPGQVAAQKPSAPARPAAADQSAVLPMKAPQPAAMAAKPAVAAQPSPDGKADGAVEPRVAKPVAVAPATAGTPTVSQGKPAPVSATVSPAAKETGEPAARPAAPGKPTVVAKSATRAAGAADPGAAAPKGKIPLIDAEIFRSTRASMKKFDTLVEFYRTDTADYLTAIGEALAMGKVDDAVLPAHTIKSSSRIVGASGLALLAETFEARARTGETANLEELSKLRAQMERIFRLTLQAIDKLSETGDKSNAA